MLKAIGAIWENTNPKSKTRYSGKIDLGALGEVDIKLFDNDKQEEKHPDMTLHIVVASKKSKN